MNEDNKNIDEIKKESNEPVKSVPNIPKGFQPIFNEEFRIYLFPQSRIEIKDPMSVFVERNGTHHVVDKNGLFYLIKPHFDSMIYKPKQQNKK